MKKTYARMAVRIIASAASAIRFRMSMMTQMNDLMQAKARYRAGCMRFFEMRTISTISKIIVTPVMAIWMPAEVLQDCVLLSAFRSSQIRTDGVQMRCCAIHLATHLP